MENEIKDLESLQKDLEKNGQKLEEVNMLFLDMSSSCTGYALVSVNFTKKSAKFINSGVMWFDDNQPFQEKYHYLFNAIVNYFNIVGQISYCVAEAYVINSKKMMGAQRNPEMHGVLQVALAEIGVKYSTILMQTWRKQLGIVPNVTTNFKGKKERDYKTPTKNYVNSIIPNVPTAVKSNITNNMRTTPSDLYDALAIAMGFLKKLGVVNLDTSKIKFQESIQL